MDETACNYISTWGVRRSCVKTSVDDGQRLSNYKFNDIKYYDTVYIKLDFIPEFSKMIDSIDAKFILVSSCSDYTTPTDLFNETNFLNFINHKNIIHWYCQNCVYKHEKITLLPIGIDYHTMSNRHYKWGEMATPVEQERLLKSVIEVAKPFWERNIIAYSNCHFQMNTRYGYDRVDALNYIPKEVVYYEPTEIRRFDTWNHQINYAFVISPHGNGLDCHRLWEALILGCIPIVKTSPLDDMYQDLPVLIVKSWSDITQDLLNTTIVQFKETKFNYDKLTLKYWIQKINEHV